MIQPETGHTNEKGRNTMKCPKCGNELRESKKSPGYFLCDSCKKKFSQETLNRFQNKKPVRKKETAPSTPVEEDPKPAALEQTYSNIPPEEVRNEREKEMKANYEAMLNIKDEKSSDEKESDELLPEEPGEPALGGLRILIGIVSILCAAFIAYQAYDSGIFTTFIHTPGLTGIAGMILAVCFLIGGVIVLCTHRKNSVPAFLIPCIFYLGGAFGGFFVPGSVFTVQILLFVSALIGAILLFALCCAKEVHPALRILIFIIIVALTVGVYYASHYLVPESSIVSGKSLRLTTDDFTVSFEKIETGTDYEGEDALMVYYTITNKSSEALVPSVAVTFKAMQDDTTLDPTIVSDEPLSENESAEVGKGDSVRVCTSFILLDQSDVTLQLYETFGAGSKTAETTLSLE